jgi:hypothetical protein
MFFGRREMEIGTAHQYKESCHSVLISRPVVDAEKPVLGFLEGCPLVCTMLCLLD